MKPERPGLEPRHSRATFSDVDRAADPDLAVAYLESTAESLAGVKRQLIDRLRVEPGQRILDIGCGAGHDLVLIAEARAVAIGIDPSLRMVEASGRRCPQAEVVLGDGASLPYVSASFDGCRIERVLQHVDDPLAVLDEAARVLRSDGRIALFEPDWGSFAIESDDAAAQAAITKAVMLGVRHARAGLQLRDLLAGARFTVDDIIVDVGRYTRLADVRRFIDLDVVCSRAVAAGWLKPDEVRNWENEMIERSTHGRFQATFNRMIAVAHT